MTARRRSEIAPSDAAFGYLLVSPSNQGMFLLMDEQHRSCRCGAFYRRTESMAEGREVAAEEDDPVLKAKFEKQATAYRKLATDRAA